MAESFLNGKIQLHSGDCLKVLPTLAENSVDSCVTDPPYHLLSIGARFSKPDSKPPNSVNNLHQQYNRLSRGFMGKVWDGGDIAFRPETWRAVYRVLKPGAHMLVFGGTRTYHRMACAIEDAGFEVRDCIQWLYGSGFPKSHDVSKGIDRAAGAEREIVGRIVRGDVEAAKRDGVTMAAAEANRNNKAIFGYGVENVTVPATDAARQWEGWGTALKPACELITLARKPLSEKTIAANVLRWGTGAININECRVETTDEQSGGFGNGKRPWETGDVGNNTVTVGPEIGRWPANVIHDGSEEVIEAFPDGLQSGTGAVKRSAGTGYQANAYGKESHPVGTLNVEYGDSGSAARFYYTAKADSDDRLGSKHPTVKPLDLMQWLVRLVTPRNGGCLDPFAGTGTTGEAAWREGFSAILIEREEEYQTDIRRRMKLCLAGPDERIRESIKARGLTDSPGPLFDAFR